MAGENGKVAVEENEYLMDGRTNERGTVGDGRGEQEVDKNSQRKTIDFFLSRYEKRDVGELDHD